MRLEALLKQHAKTVTQESTTVWLEAVLNQRVRTAQQESTTVWLEAMQECDAGKYNSVAGSVPNSGRTVRRKYNSVAGSDAEAQCKECDAGKYNSVAGSSAESACKDCAAEIQQCGWK